MDIRFKITTIIILYVLFFSVCVAFSNSKEDPIQTYKKAWNYIENGNLDKARELVIKNYKTEEGEYKVFWLVIESTIYLLEEKYEKALETIEPFKKKLKDRYYFLKENPEEESKVAIELVTWNFKKMLTISSTANFKLGNWIEALTDMVEENSNGFEKQNYYLKAVCFYHTKNYPEALINFEYAYKSAQSNDIKAESAFNIACIYSKLNNVDQTISWLKISLTHNRKEWFQKISQEHDFDTIRNNIKFKTFIVEQKRIDNNE